MEKFKKQIWLAVSTTMLLQSAMSTAFAAGLQCRIIFDEPRLAALQVLSQDQRTSLSTTLWQRLLNGNGLKNFSVDEYKQALQQLLLGEKSASDDGMWLSSAGKLAVIEFLNITSGNALKADDILTRLENLSAFSQRTAMQLLDKDLTTALSREFMDQWSQSFFLTLRGANVRVLDYLTMKSDARAQKQMGGLLQEQLLSYGLKGVLAEMGLPEASIKERIQIMVTKILSKTSPLTSLLALRLPGVRQVQLSDQLMTKVLIDGADTHKAEIEKELAPQIGRNRWEVARKILGPVMAVGTVLYFYTGNAAVIQVHSSEVVTETVAAKNAQDKAKLEAQLQQAGVVISETALNMNAIQYQQTVNSLHEKWGRWPNADEMQFLLNDIYGKKLSKTDIQGLVTDLYNGHVSLQNGDVLESVPSRVNQLISAKENKG